MGALKRERTHRPTRKRMKQTHTAQSTLCGCILSHDNNIYIRETKTNPTENYDEEEREAARQRAGATAKAREGEAKK